ncbi:hypothetical protein F0562_012060 [Nyssa sinensis]|uniref:Uncharacterized protein n=1 Tax=Nyssa sinensis TaxID=561372 RepID=A0A5J4ZUM1_9ASTE|nr:hypothetical protein F0562_012060 [Nyssa sinensis]
MAQNTPSLADPQQPPPVADNRNSAGAAPDPLPAPTLRWLHRIQHFVAALQPTVYESVPIRAANVVVLATVADTHWRNRPGNRSIVAVASVVIVVGPDIGNKNNKIDHMLEPETDHRPVKHSLEFAVVAGLLVVVAAAVAVAVAVAVGVLRTVAGVVGAVAAGLLKEMKNPLFLDVIPKLGFLLVFRCVFLPLGETEETDETCP